MTPALGALGLRAVACKAWEWRAGMAVVDGNGWVWRLGEDGFWRHARGLYNGREYEPNLDPPRDAIPDLSDAATLGCLLALVREAWDEPELYVRSSRDDESWIVCAADHEGRERLMVLRSDPYRASEAEALVAALEAAPGGPSHWGDAEEGAAAAWADVWMTAPAGPAGKETL